MCMCMCVCVCVCVCVCGREGGRSLEFSEMEGLPKIGELFLKWGGLNPSTNYAPYIKQMELPGVH